MSLRPHHFSLEIPIFGPFAWLCPHLTSPPPFVKLVCSGYRAAALSRTPFFEDRAVVAELADAHGSGPCTRKGVGVRVPPSAPKFLNESGRIGLNTSPIL